MSGRSAPFSDQVEGHLAACDRGHDVPLELQESVSESRSGIIVLDDQNGAASMRPAISTRFTGAAGACRAARGTSIENIDPLAQVDLTSTGCFKRSERRSTIDRPETQASLLLDTLGGAVFLENPPQLIAGNPRAGVVNFDPQHVAATTAAEQIFPLLV